MEISFVRENVWLRSCKALQISGLTGLAPCLIRGITSDRDDRVEPCTIFEKAIWGNRTLRKKYCRKYLKA